MAALGWVVKLLENKGKIVVTRNRGNLVRIGVGQ